MQYVYLSIHLEIEIILRNWLTRLWVLAILKSAGQANSLETQKNLMLHLESGDLSFFSQDLQLI